MTRINMARVDAARARDDKRVPTRSEIVIEMITLGLDAKKKK